MDERTLGRTGLVVSRIGLGLAALGRPGYVNLGHGEDLTGRVHPEQLAAHTGVMLDAAFAAGVRYVDAARSYGLAEEFLGRWLSSNEVRAERVTIGSKWGYTYRAGWQTDPEVHEVKDHGIGTLERQWAETRTHLGDHIDLYQIHSATLETGVLADRAVLTALARLRDSGTAIGLSTSGPAQAATIERALDIDAKGRPLFDVVQTTWNLLETSAETALIAAAERGVGVIVKETVANGLLTDRNPSLPAVLRDLDIPADVVAIAAALARPWAAVVLSGASTIEQLRSNLRAAELPVDVAHSLPDLAEDPASYWARRSDMPWT